MRIQASLNEFAEWLKAHDDYVLIGHVNPDGDSIGSTIAVCRALRALGKRAFVLLPNPVPPMYQCFPDWTEALQADSAQPFIPQTAFALDVSEPERMGDLRSVYESCPAQAMFDHHGTNPGFGQIQRVEEHCAATGEMAVRLLDALNAPIDSITALWLFVAISTDTGHFRFPATAPSTMQATARLLEAGIDIADITQKLWYSRSLPRTRLLGAVLNELQVSADGRISYARMTHEMLERCAASRADSEGIVNYLLEIEGVRFAALAEERENGTKFSLRARAQANIDVSQIAAQFGGGGHALAAGCTLNMPLDEAIDAVLAQARIALDGVKRDE